MKVILLTDVKGLGKALDVKEVKDGYGFNYLLPEGLAELANPGAIKQAERFVMKRKEEASQMIAEARILANALSGKKVNIQSKAENGKLFGSVGKDEIISALAATGVNIEKKVLVVDKPFKEVGTFEISADFGHDIKVMFELVIQAA